MEPFAVLTTLAQSGGLGPVANGAVWGTVVEEFGKPRAMDGETSRWPRLFAYGDLELSVCQCQKIVLVCLQTWRDVIELPVGLADIQAFPGRPTYSDVIGALDRAGCVWEPYMPLTFNDQRAIRAAASGVVFVFEISEGEVPILNVAGTQAHQHDCPATRRPAAN